jgi:DNA-directed RNA polymerase I subunit RPA1
VQLTLVTDGVSFGQAWDRADLVDANRIDCNDIHAILCTFGTPRLDFCQGIKLTLTTGVEAARAAIVNQVASVFQVYGIQVNRRHLGLIADYMVRSVFVSFVMSLM